MATKTFDLIDICEIFAHWHAGRAKNQTSPSRPRRCPRYSNHSAGSPPTTPTTAAAPSIVCSITAAYRGTIRACLRPGGGLIVEIDLPPAFPGSGR